MAISIAKPVGTEIGIETGLATLLVGFFAIFNGAAGRCWCADRPVYPEECCDAFIPPDCPGIGPDVAGCREPAFTYSHSHSSGDALAGGLPSPDRDRVLFRRVRLSPLLRGCLLAYGAGAIAGPQLAGFIKTRRQLPRGIPWVAALALVGIVIAFLLMKPPVKG